MQKLALCQVSAGVLIFKVIYFRTDNEYNLILIPHILYKKNLAPFQTIVQRTIDKTYLNEVKGYVHILLNTTMYTMKNYFFP